MKSSPGALAKGTSVHGSCASCLVGHEVVGEKNEKII